MEHNSCAGTATVAVMYRSSGFKGVVSLGSVEFLVPGFDWQTQRNITRINKLADMFNADATVLTCSQPLLLDISATIYDTRPNNIAPLQSFLKFDHAS